MIFNGVKFFAAAGATLLLATGCKDEERFDPAKISSNLGVFTQASSSLSERRLIEVPIGELTLPDGKLVSLDPLVQPEKKPFTRVVEPGSYPVSFIRSASEHSRPAFLVIRFSQAQVKKFEIATIEGQDVATLKDDEFFGIGVDAGIAGFANAGYGAARAKFEAAEQEKPGSQYSNYYDDVIANAMPGKEADEFAVDHPLKGEDGAAAMTQAGWGDGYYPTFWGLDKDNKPVLAFIEFFVITDGDGRSDAEKEEAAALSKMTVEQQADNKAAFKALEAGDDVAFEKFLVEKRITPKDYILGRGGSFLLEAIRQDRPAALRAMLEAGADDAPAPSDQFLSKSYSAFARSMDEYAAKAKAEGKSMPAPRSKELMGVVAELEKRPGTSDQSKSSTQE